MKSQPHYATEVAVAHESATVRQLAERMAVHAVGSVVIVDEERRPIGIVTDRDLCCRVVARGLDPATTLAIDVATRPVQVAASSEPIELVVERMRKLGVRRIPIVEDDSLVGLVALDDLVVSLGRELDHLGAAAKHAIRDTLRAERSTRRRAEIEETLASLEASALAAGRDAFEFVSREFETLRERLRRDRG